MEDAYTLLEKGKLLVNQGHFHQAAIVLERASRLEPDKASIRELLARSLYISGQTERAQDEFQRVIEIDPSNDYGYYGLGLCHARAGELAKARGKLKIAVAMRPDIGAYRKALSRLPG